MLIIHLFILFGETSIKSFPHFLIGWFAYLLLICKYLSYCTCKSLTRSMICKKFSHSVGCLLTLLMVSFKVQILIVLNFIFFPFVLVLWCHVKVTIAWFRITRIYACFCLREFSSCHFKKYSLIHSDLIFVNGGGNSSIFCMGISSCPTGLSWNPCWISTDYKY